MSPVERAAKAAIDAENAMRGIDTGSPLWGKTIARAVLGALREPSEAMAEAAAELWWLDFEGDEEVKLRVTTTQAHQIFQAMVDKALAQ